MTVTSLWCFNTESDGPNSSLRSTAGKAPFFKSGMKGDIIFIRCIANI